MWHEILARQLDGLLVALSMDAAALHVGECFDIKHKWRQHRYKSDLCLQLTMKAPWLLPCRRGESDWYPSSVDGQQQIGMYLQQAQRGGGGLSSAPCTSTAAIRP